MNTDDKAKEPLNHTFHFVPLRNLWLAMVKEVDRVNLYPNANTAFPPSMVTTSVFTDRFWSTLSRRENSVIDQQKRKMEIHPERVWFGIRSLLKGGPLGHQKNVFEEKDFAQLHKCKSDSERPQVPARRTDNYFKDEELRKVIEIHTKYESWKTKQGLYDDLDIVKTAMKHHSGRSALNYEKHIRDTSNLKDEIIEKALNFGNERFHFKQAALTRIVGLNKKQKKVLGSWLDKWSKAVHKSIRLGNAKNGISVYKQYLGSKGETGGARIFFSLVKEEKRNRGTPYLIIYDIEYNHAKQDKVIRTILILEDDDSIDGVTEVKLNAEKVRSIDDTPGFGPTKPLPGPVSIEALDRLNDKGNISLDYNQKIAICQDQPLLIDGLAGTGKTAVLAKRAAFRAGWSETNTSILITATKSHVVKRLLDDIERTIDNTKWPREGITWRYLGTGFDSELFIQQTLPQFSRDWPEYGFDEILVDECQDITPLEFKLLSRLANGHNPRRLSLAGDPLQTLNPTGFDWNRIKAMFRDAGVDKKHVETSKFHSNYRSQEYIVLLANAIQRHREKLFPGQKAIAMDSKRPAKSLPKLIRIANEGDRLAAKEAIKNSGLSEVIVICWAPDDAAIMELMTGENKDDILNEIWTEIPDDKEGDLHFRTKMLIHSSSSIKGGEYDAVLLYKFASSETARENLTSLTKKRSDINSVSMADKISVAYAYSRLYVAVTRAFEKVYFLEDEEGFEFWKKVKLEDENGETKNFIDVNSMMNASKAFNSLEFKSSSEATYKNFRVELKGWDQDDDIVHLQGAVRLGKKLVEDGNEKISLDLLNKLRGDLYHAEARMAPTQSVKKEKLDKAIRYYEMANKHEMLAPLKFNKEDWPGCYEAVKGSNTHFTLIIEYYCRYKMGDLESDLIDSSPADSLINELKRESPGVNPKLWDFVDLDSLKKELKNSVIKSLINNQLYDLLTKNVNVFGRSEIIRMLPPEAPETMVDLIEGDRYNMGDYTGKYIDAIRIIMGKVDGLLEQIDFLISKRRKTKGEINQGITQMLLKKRIEFLRAQHSISDDKVVKIIMDGRHNPTKQPQGGINGFEQLMGLHQLFEISSMSDALSMEIDIEEEFGERVTMFVSSAKARFEMDEFDTALLRLRIARTKKTPDKKRLEYLAWIDNNEILDRYAMKIQELNHTDVDVLHGLIGYSKIIEVKGNMMFQKVLETVNNSAKMYSNTDLDILYSDLARIILPNGRKATNNEVEFISNYVQLRGSIMDAKDIQALASSELKLSSKIWNTIKLLDFRQSNKVLLAQIKIGKILETNKQLAHEYIRLLDDYETKVNLSEAEHVRELIPIDINEIREDMMNATSISSFYEIAKRVMKQDKGKMSNVLSPDMFIEAFNKLNPTDEELTKKGGHEVWDLLCSNNNETRFALLDELCQEVSNPMCIITTCSPKYHLISMIRKYSSLNGINSDTDAEGFFTTILNDWCTKKRDPIQSKIKGGAKRMKTISVDDKSTLTKINDIETAIWKNKLRQHMSWSLTISLAECNIKELRLILGELSIAKLGKKVEMIERILLSCNEKFTDTHMKIVEIT